MVDFIMLAALIGMAFLVWDCVEVGRNDATNLVNAVFGARVLQRRTAIIIAGVAVVLGATFSAPVMETARKIAAKSTATVAFGKPAFYQQAEKTLAGAYEHAAAVMVENMLARDAEEGINAFIEKRRPVWTDS